MGSIERMEDIHIRVRIPRGNNKYFRSMSFHEEKRRGAPMKTKRMRINSGKNTTISSPPIPIFFEIDHIPTERMSRIRIIDGRESLYVFFIGRGYFFSKYLTPFLPEY
jgi:hypothetical protein